jgi:sulfite exporter TauE/SafE/copper chaperone CopZ
MSTGYYKCEFLVEGMHCAACELVIEKKLSKFKQVRNVDAQLAQNKVSLEIKNKYDAEQLRAELSKAIEADGYKLVVEKSKHEIKKDELIKAGIIAALIMGAFLLLQKTGLIDLVNTDKLTLPFVFLIGVIASLSSCMAVVGGLVLSLSSSYAQGKQFKPMVFFHIARLISFFILGGVVGLLGSAFVLTPSISFVLSIILFAVMLIMGLNLLDVFPFVRKLQFKLPKSFGKKALSLAESKNVFTPILLGAATFILPCGFTQSMQVYSLTTGSFTSGAVTMLVFALGTFPVLALISIASVKMSTSLQSGLFFKTAGFIILFFALFNFLAALAAIGLIQPIFNI